MYTMLVMNQENSQMRVLITGATGFIGSALADYFFSKGMRIRALTRNQYHPDVVRCPQYEWIFGDLTESDSLSPLCDDIDFVFHAAGFAHASKNNDPDFQQKHHEINYKATLWLAELAQKAKVGRFIFFSSVKAVAEKNECIDENWAAIPTDAYGESKRVAEEKLLQLSMDVVILRLSLVYGVGWKGNLNTLLKAIEKNVMPAMPTVKNKKSMVSLQDVCEVAKCAAFANLQSQRVFIVTDGMTYATKEIEQVMRKALGYQNARWYLPLWVWILFGKIGDALQKIMNRSLPINSEAIEKLFGSTQYASLYIKDHLGFVPKYTFSDIIPDIVIANRHKS